MPNSRQATKTNARELRIIAICALGAAGLALTLAFADPEHSHQNGHAFNTLDTTGRKAVSDSQPHSRLSALRSTAASFSASLSKALAAPNTTQVESSMTALANNARKRGTRDARQTPRAVNGSRAQKVTTLWSEIKESQATPHFSRRDHIPDPVHVSLYRAAATGVTRGDIAEITIPNVGDFTAIVDQVLVSSNGDRGWRGHIEAVDDHYPVLFTQGPVLTFATIATPRGTFLLEGRGDY